MCTNGNGGPSATGSSQGSCVGYLTSMMSDTDVDDLDPNTQRLMALFPAIPEERVYNTLSFYGTGLTLATHDGALDTDDDYVEVFILVYQEDLLVRQQKILDTRSQAHLPFLKLNHIQLHNLLVRENQIVAMLASRTSVDDASGDYWNGASTDTRQAINGVLCATLEEVTR